MNREANPIKFASNMFRALAVHHGMLSDASWRFSALLTTEADTGGVVVHIWHGADVVGFMFRMAWPLWNAHKGKVPRPALFQLEKDGDWPSGCARAIMNRISRDSDVRDQLLRWDAKQ